MIKPEQRTHEIVGYVTQTYKKVLQIKAKQRGISLSAMINLALFDFLNPTMTAKSAPILRLDRSPKGSKEPLRKRNFRECIEELKVVLEKRRGVEIYSLTAHEGGDEFEPLKIRRKEENKK